MTSETLFIDGNGLYLMENYKNHRHATVKKGKF